MIQQTVWLFAAILCCAGRTEAVTERNTNFIFDFDVLLQFFVYCITVLLLLDQPPEYRRHSTSVINCKKDVPSNMNAGIRFQCHKSET
jgi:hypothetical protein